MSLKYLIIGAGGTGGCIGAFMTEAGKDVTLIARGEHLEQIRDQGLRMQTTLKGNYTVPVRAMEMREYQEQPDIIFVCVKGYSLEETIPFIQRIAGSETIVIPILNIYGTGGRMQEKLPELLVTDGCIYVAAQIREPGCIWMNGDIFRVVFGVRKPAEFRKELRTVEQDLKDSGILPILSDNIQRDALMKFSYVSPMAACGQYYDVTAEAMQKPGEARETFTALVHEIELLAQADGIDFEKNMVDVNLKILDDLTPEASTSMQRDILAGKPSEIDGLLFEVVRMARRSGISLPIYEKIAGALKPQFDAEGRKL